MTTFASFTGISSSARISLKTPDDPSLIQEGSTVLMTCKANGDIVPVFTFYRDSTELSTGSSNRLRLQAVSTSDNGVYSCKAENRAGVVWTTGANITINILGKSSTHSLNHYSRSFTHLPPGALHSIHSLVPRFSSLLILLASQENSESESLVMRHTSRSRRRIVSLKKEKIFYSKILAGGMDEN